MKPFVFTTLLLCASCATGQVRDEPVRTPDGKYVVELTEHEKKLMPKWLEYDCAVDFKKTGQYQKCVATITNSLSPLDPMRREHFGEEYDPERYYECRMKTSSSNMGCNKHRLRRAENPAFWPYPDLPPPKLPEPPNPPVYKAGMSAKQYFDALCKAEAGDFIYKTVEDVDGIYQIRPLARMNEIGNEDTDRYVLEDPYGYRQWLSDGPQYLFVRRQEHYEFFETSALGRISKEDGSPEAPDPGSQGPASPLKYYRYYDTPPFNLKNRRREPGTELKNRYGYLWRGIPRPHDRELAIAGGELIVLDLRTNEILAIHRGFNLNGRAPNRSGIYWRSGPVCPKQEEPTFFYQKFIERVLKPRQHSNK
jgi:hypothetical protein